MRSTRPAMWWRSIAVLIAVALAAAACGDDGEGAGGTDGGVETPDEPPGDPTPGGRLVYGLEAETSGGFCLSEAQLAISGIQVARTIYDTLTAPNGEGEYVGMLATDVVPNDDHTEWAITIREGVTFHDGTPLDADVVANNLDAYMGNYREVEGQERPGRHGDGERTSLLFTIVLDLVEAIEVTGDMEVTVTLADPWPSFPAFLWSSGRFGIMAQAQLDSDACTTEMIGTGPFELVSWRVDDRLVASRFEDYWHTGAEGEQLPYLDEIEYRPIVEGAQRVNQLESGEIQAFHTSGSITIGNLRELRDQGTVGLVESAAYPETLYYMLNAGKPPFDSQTAREAVAHALDREEINELRALGIPTLASGPFGPGNMGYLEDTGYPEHDPDRARELVAQYEAESGEDFVVRIAGGTDPEAMATTDLIQQYLEDVGISVRRQGLEQTQLINTALAGDFEMVGWRNHPGGDPDGQYVWWRSGYPTNFGRIDDPDIDRLLDEGRASADPEEREEIYQELNRVFAERLYNLWQSWTTWAIGTAPGVHGIFGPPLPDGSEAFPGLGTGHPVSTLWIEQ